MSEQTERALPASNEHTMNHQPYPHCHHCGDPINPARALLGYKTCLPCGEEEAKEARTHWCVAPMHKSNYMLITDPSLLTGLNNKGGLVK